MDQIKNAWSWMGIRRGHEVSRSARPSTSGRPRRAFQPQADGLEKRLPLDGSGGFSPGSPVILTVTASVDAS